MAKEIVLLFAGQGAQRVGMGRDLAETYPEAKAKFDQASELLGFDLAAAMFDGPMEELTRTSRCQPALYVHGLACLEILKNKVPDLRPVAAAGLSLGEFTAHAAGGTFDFESGLNLVAKRGAFMEEATNATEGSMAAMLGAEDDEVRRLAADCGVDVANYNAPSQVVISGPKTGVAEAVEKAEDYNVRIAKELPVAGAYHSRLMQPAQEKLARELGTCDLRMPEIPVICNVEAREVRDEADIRQTLAAQVTGSVRWAESMRYLIEQGHTTFVELGPGRVLAGLMKRIDRSVTMICAEDVATIDAAAEALG